MSITIAARKAKGRKLQNEVAERISKHTGFSCKGDNAPIRPALMGESGSDVKLSDEVQELFPFYIECKNHTNWSIASFVQQLKEGCDKWNAKTHYGQVTLYPVLFVTRNHLKQPFAVMTYEDLFYALDSYSIANSLELLLFEEKENKFSLQRHLSELKKMPDYKVYLFTLHGDTSGIKYAFMKMECFFTIASLIQKKVKRLQKAEKLKKQND